MAEHYKRTWFLPVCAVCLGLFLVTVSRAQAPGVQQQTQWSPNSSATLPHWAGTQQATSASNSDSEWRPARSSDPVGSRMQPPSGSGSLFPPAPEAPPSQPTNQGSISQGTPSSATWSGLGSSPGTQSQLQSPPVQPTKQSGSMDQIDTSPRSPIGTNKIGSLPAEHGQIWREYDISPYTLRVNNTPRPEQAIVDWILRETGYEAWHSQIVAVLSADRNKLRVYHTPQMHELVAGIVERFVRAGARQHQFSVRLITVSFPNWRSAWQHVLQPIQIQSPGVQAFVLHKEDAAMLLAELRRRSDFREHSSPNLVIVNGQPTVISANRSRQFIKAVSLRPNNWAGFEAENAVVDEGFTLEFTPLVSADGTSVDAVVDLRINQVEKMVSVPVDILLGTTPQRTKIEVPQRVGFSFQQRFRWPTDQVLLVDLGMVPVPVLTDGAAVLGGLRLPMLSGPPRGNVLIMVECKAATSDQQMAGRTCPPVTRSY